MIKITGPKDAVPGAASGGISDAQLNASPLAANLVGGEPRGVGQRRRAAQRSGRSYSRFVSGMKVLLPFLALGLVALIIIWPRLKSDDTFRIGFSSVRLSGSSEPGIDNARYMGTDENRQPYTVTADLARIEADGQYSLEMPKADLTLDDGTWLVLTANTGRFRQGQQELELQGDVNLFHDTGYEISTDELLLDLQRNVAESHTPVTGHGPFGELKAQGLKLIDKGRIIYFTGPAQLILFPAQGDADLNSSSGAQK
ncbi:MAG: LPS export ABC transporter periplasmic protein LptC [Magnetovibrio sp.]|nr:LPS export ABC transporter periplasmic protein LptC [Magnetovibrio sp.]